MVNIFYGQYVFMVSMFLWSVCFYDQNVIIVSIFLWSVCFHGQYVFMFILWSECFYGQNVFIYIGVFIVRIIIVFLVTVVYCI